MKAWNGGQAGPSRANVASRQYVVTKGNRAPGGWLVATACPDCGAGVGVQCVSVTGRVFTRGHEARRRLSARLLNQQERPFRPQSEARPPGLPVACTTCAVRAGDPCLDSRGKSRKPHASRRASISEEMEHPKPLGAKGPLLAQILRAMEERP